MSSTAGKMELDSVVIRFGGEMGIKGTWTRRIYEHRLLENIKSTLKRDKIVYKGFLRKHGRLYLKTSSVKEASSSLSKVFGISSVSPALETTSRLDDVVSRSVSLASLALNKGNSFAVKCKRVGNQPYKSRDVCREVGRQILTELPELGLSVNLGNPDVTFGIDIRDDYAFIYSTAMNGVGGLPLGTQPKVVCLLNGDVNSAVASWLAMKRGCPIVPVHFSNSSSGKDAVGKTLDILRVLFDWAAGFPKKTYVVPTSKNLAPIEESCDKKLVPILSKRMMYRISERIAQMEKAEGIITGETITERPSQTLCNLRLSNAAVQNYPVHRPLIGFDKTEIEELARKIGIREISAEEPESHAMVEKELTLDINPEEITQAEAKLNIEDIIQKSVESLEIMRL